jgi:hypothetical protein
LGQGFLLCYIARKYLRGEGFEIKNYFFLLLALAASISFLIASLFLVFLEWVFLGRPTPVFLLAIDLFVIIKLLV